MAKRLHTDKIPDEEKERARREELFKMFVEERARRLNVAYQDFISVMLNDHADDCANVEECLKKHPTPTYIEVPVLCPAGVKPGDTVEIKVDDGRELYVAVPPGVYPGDTFLVNIPVMGKDAVG